MRGSAGIVAALLIGVSGLTSACGQEKSTRAVIEVDAPAALADRPVHLTVSGLAAGDEITVAATAADHRRSRWRGQATFRADDRGRVDLNRARPASGTYSAIDGMGLFWSMRPPAGDPEEVAFEPPFPSKRPSYSVQITVTAHGRELAQRTLTRQWLSPGVTRRVLSMSEDEVSGELFLPPPGTRRRPAVLLIGGSEGGNLGQYDAALLASHGYPALALAYFGAPGLPAALRDIPLEYFERALRLLADQPGADPERMVVRGYSRGSEAALLLGQHYPRLVKGVIVYAPSSDVFPGFPDRGNAWTHKTRPVPQRSIPLDRVDGPVLAIAGTDDRLWDSEFSARQIMIALDQSRDRFPHQALVYPGAGHGVGTIPYLAQGTRLRNPATGAVLALGGTRPADAAARAQGWPKTLAFLTGLQR
ncbi:acyl-CoA thioesterase/BAAT N-terminal domain-containing protein [Actinomadura sp. 9N407]|uniref:acyl-CoA thioesterase/BAAT N-terminal domain-containing protein n=1 Tax=Actinomadura sp. 9N407 TaxID=3375154 RepID=UPI0037BA9B3F